MKSCPNCGYDEPHASNFSQLAKQKVAVLVAGRTTRRAALAPKEEKYVGMIFEGMTNVAIAAEVGTSEQCVKNVLKSAYQKLGVQSRYELIYKAFREGGFQLWLYRGEKYRASAFENAAERHAAELRQKARAA